jgi:bacteriorhodopsin
MNYNPNDIFNEPLSSGSQSNEKKHTDLSELRKMDEGEKKSSTEQFTNYNHLSNMNSTPKKKKQTQIPKNQEQEEDLHDVAEIEKDVVSYNKNASSSSSLTLVNSSFYLTYIFLMTTATITFIEAIRTKIPEIRNILNLETCISVVAAFFYSKFIKMMEDHKKKLRSSLNKENYQEKMFQEINQTRYLDWSITTPIMLLVLVLALLYNNKMGGMNFFYFIIILLLNYGMLASGYMGENEMLDKTISGIIGFIFFIALYGFIYYVYVMPDSNYDNNLIYGSFIILWAIYGILYYFDEKVKNIGYNVLDLFAKCFVGIFFWAYYAKVFVL